ncbi:MAG: glycosyltransferase [Thiolinea sp.]
MSKIAMVIGDLGTPGGAERVAYDLANEFEQRGYELTVITFEEKNKPAYLPVPGRHIHISIPSQPGSLIRQLWIMLKRAWCFRRVMKQEKFDHIFAFLETANVPCALASTRSVLSVHLDPDEWSERQQKLVKLTFQRARRVIAVSSQMKNKLERKLGLNNVVRVINPVDSQLICTMAEESLEQTEPFILAVGRLNRQKRFDRLIRAYAESGLSSECQLIILGDGELRNTLERQIAELNLQNRVLLKGLAKNPYRFMARAEFLVMSSDYEGYPLVLIEALVLGCPVISTDCPTGPCEIVRPEINGLLTAQGDEKALSQAMNRLYVDGELRAKLARQAPGTVVSNDIRRVADTWLEA